MCVSKYVSVRRKLPNLVMEERGLWSLARKVRKIFYVYVHEYSFV